MEVKREVFQGLSVHAIHEVSILVLMEVKRETTGIDPYSPVLLFQSLF